MRNTTIALLALLCACGAPSATDNTTAAEQGQTPAEVVGTSAIAPEGAKLRVYEAASGKHFPGATFSMQVMPDPKAMDAEFKFSIKGYVLREQTTDAGERGCANSPDGQHLHLIINNKPYLAKYDSVFREKLEPGHNVVLAFLSRSYHESLKEVGQYQITDLFLPGGGGVPEHDYLNAQNLYYSRPKGEYKKSESTKILLDFYLTTTTLSDNGDRVRATIDGEPWILTKWAPYFIEGLELGEHTVRLELLDKNGALIPGPFNDSGERKFKVLEG